MTAQQVSTAVGAAAADPATRATPPGVPTGPGPEAVAEQIRRDLFAVADPGRFDLRLLAVTGHRGPEPTVFELPLSRVMAEQLKKLCAAGATEAAEAELVPLAPATAPADQQWLHAPLGAGPLETLDQLVATAAPRQYARTERFGPRNVLVFVLSDAGGRVMARLYQGFSLEKSLQRSRVFGIWTGERFDTLGEPLVIDRDLRLVVVGGWVVMRSARVYEAVAGPLPGLAETAGRTFDATVGQLDVVGGPALRKACLTDPRMAHKLASVQAKLGAPGYPESLTMPRLLSFLDRNPQLEIPVDRSGPEPRLVFDAAPQHRWQLLKLLDDDYLQSDLTQIRYEATAKTRLA